MRIQAVVRAALAFALSLAATSLVAQQGSAELRGRVSDEQGAALPGATVVIKHQESGIYRQANTTTDGSYYMAGVTPGPYELTVELTGFKRVSRRDVRLEVGKTTTIDLALQVGGLQEELTVTAESPIVDITSKEVGGHITDRELTDLPSINRNYIGFIGLLPGVIPNISTESFGSDSVSVNGQDARNNNYLLDGGNNNDDVIGQRAGTQARTPLEAIQEFQVLTNQYDAEFGRTTGAIVNAITKQGTNSFHGSAFAFVQDASLSEKNYFVAKNNLPKPDTTFQQYGFTLGGPVIRDKAHFFVSVERVIEDLGQDIAIPARPDLNAAPVRETRVWNTLVRFDHQINADHTWSVRWLRESSPQFNQIIPVVNPIAGVTGTFPVTLDAAREEDDLDQTVAASLNSVLGNTRVNTLRFAWTQEDVSFGTPNFNSNGRHQDQLLPSLLYRTYYDQQNSVAQARVNDGWQVEDTFSWFIPGSRGDHNLRVGIQYQRSTNKATTQDNWNGTFSIPSDRAFTPGDFSTYPERLSIRVPGESLTDMKADYFGAFIQDKWQLSRRLTLSLGLRYDLEKIPIEELDNPEFSDPNDYPVDGNNIAPRVGFAWDMKGDGQTVVRGGYGRFYDKTHYELITGIITAGVFSNSFVVNFPANAADPGPSQGRAPTDPMLVDGPTVNRALLNQMFPPGTKTKNTGTVLLDSPDRVIPYTDQFTVGFEKALFRNFSLGVDYVHAAGRSQFMSLEKNPGVRVDTSRTGRVVRVDPSFTASVLQRINVGEIDYDALLVGLERRWANNYRFRVSYTLGKSRGNTSGNGIPISNLQFLNDMNLDANEGPTDVDRRHNLVLSGALIVPKTGGLTVSTVARYLSGTAFTIQDQSSDPDQNGILFDPLPAGTYSGTGDDAITVENAGGRNGAYGPSFFQWDMRLGYQLRLRGTSRVELFGECFNLTNRANFDNPSGDRRLATFLVVTALRPGGVPRTFQLGARFVF
jgi:outer membrane receptor protein involved in Fe transport